MNQISEKDNQIKQLKIINGWKNLAATLIIKSLDDILTKDELEAAKITRTETDSTWLRDEIGRSLIRHGQATRFFDSGDYAIWSNIINVDNIIPEILYGIAKNGEWIKFGEIDYGQVYDWSAFFNYILKENGIDLS